MGEARNSAYYDKPIPEVATDWGRSLVKEAQSGELNSDVNYGISTYVVADVILAGGGPGAHVRFTFEESAKPETLFEYEPLEAELHYYEWDGRATYLFTMEEAALLWDRLTTPPEDYAA